MKTQTSPRIFSGPMKKIKWEYKCFPFVFTKIASSSTKFTIASKPFREYVRLHESCENVTPADVYFVRKGSILAGRKEAKCRILQARKEHKRKLRELDKLNSAS